MLRVPAKGREPSCFGLGSESLDTCPKCKLRTRCDEYLIQHVSIDEALARQMTRHLRAQTRTQDWTGTRAASYCEYLSDAAGLYRLYREKKAQAHIDEALAFCERNGLDPLLWFQAQFDTLEKWAQSKDLLISSALFRGPESVRRFREFVFKPNRVLYAFHDNRDLYRAEYAFGDAVFQSSTKYHNGAKEAVQQDFPAWDPDDWDKCEIPRLTAAVSLINQASPRATERISPPNQPWSWSDLKEFLIRMEVLGGAA